MEIRVAVKSLRGFEDLPKAAIAALADAVADGQNDVLNAIVVNLSGDVLQSRTGNLRNSFRAGPIEVSDTVVSGAVGSNASYARIQEEGGTVTPTNGQALTIPLDAALTASGVARFSARTLMTDPRPYLRTFIKDDIIYGVIARGDIVPLFVLRGSVTLPARPYVEPAIDRVRSQVVQRMADALLPLQNLLTTEEA